MKIHPAAVAALAAAGAAAAIVVSGASGQNSSSEQLLVNQRISQAAVRRSNAALNYLQAVRSTASDTANGMYATNPVGVQAPNGAGWLGSAISTGTYYSRVNSNGTIAGGSTGVTGARNAANQYLLTYPVDVSSCVYSATSLQNGEWPVILNPAGQPQTLLVEMNGVAGNPAATVSGQTGPFHIIVYC